MNNLPPLEIAPKIEVSRFMGKWYVIGSIPTMFEKGAYNAIEIYTWNEDTQKIDVDFSFNKDSFDGPIKKIPQTAWIYNKETNTEWRVRPFWPLSLAYLILDVSADYTETIVGVPDRKYVWLMARTPQISESRYQELYAKIQKMGFDMKQFKKVPQK